MAAQMAADGGGLRRLFEKPLPENPTLLEALSAWNHRAHPTKPIDTACFTEIFGELHFQEKTPPPPDHRAVLPPRTTAASWADEADKSKDDSSLDALLRTKPKPASSGVKRSASFCLNKSKSSASSLMMCTEGLGSEGDGHVSKDDTETDGKEAEELAAAAAKDGEEKRLPPDFPPPIRSIGRGGKPCVCFRSVRVDGRFVLMEVVIPGKELLQAFRDGGRLRLRFAKAAATDDDEGKGHAENAFAAER